MTQTTQTTYTPNVITAPLAVILHDIVQTILWENDNDVTGAARTSFIISGAPGWGKSQGFEAAIEALSIALYYLSGTSVGPAEINGVLTSLKTNGTEEAKWCRLPALPVPEADGGPSKCVLMIDDFAKAFEDIQNEFAMLITSRRTSGGGYRLPSMCSIVLTCNRPGVDNSADKPIPSYVRSRCQWYEVQQDPKDWCEWAIMHSVNPSVVGFVRYSPVAIMDKPRETGPEGCPRTMTAAARVVDRWEAGLISDDTMLRGVAGWIGETHAYSMKGFFSVRERAFDMFDIINGTEKRAPRRDDLALAWNTVIGLGTMFRNAKGKDRLKVGKGIVAYIVNARSEEGDPLDPEWAVALLRDCYRLDGPSLKKGAGPELWGRVARMLEESRRFEGDLPTIIKEA